ncbi:EAL domain-containing protein [Nitrincola tapanii]|uniref:EAL domain-containing protein n=1 Tax=Nitrincola tapanii TaxID=1708751 RepID=A0A5A9W3R5_9GAMM|nr:EAL domain-containing protein [Nitrincola tapanii]KAA0875347.1 EAL domain-containing protein [Nitrincola tapanii]
MTAVRLLILDAEARTGKELLQMAGLPSMELRTATDVSSFFDLLSAWQPDHLLIDVTLAGVDGVELLLRLADLEVDARILLMGNISQRLLEAVRLSGMAHGLQVIGVLTRPISPKSLRSLMLAEVTETHQAVGLATPSPLALPEVSVLDLQTALAQRQLSVVYQPKIECRSGALVGFEVLARWIHPQQGFIPPDLFISLAEKQGLIDELTLQVMSQALPWFHTFLSQESLSYLSLGHRAELTLSVNISAHSLPSADFFPKLMELCQSAEISPGAIIFELTETGAMEDPVASLDLLTRLRMKGFQLSIDDFGTGFSSMLQLVRMPFSEVKVDRSFVMTSADSHESRMVIKAIIELAHSLGLKVTAEGIENQEALEFLQELNCDRAQGYYIGRPMSAEQIERWMQERIQRREEQRLQTLHSLNLLDTPAEDRFDRITRLAQRLFKVTTCVISLVDAERQWFKSRVGLDVCETDRSISFCTHAIEQEEVFLVENALEDPRFAHNPLVLEAPHIRFYAGCPVRAPRGDKLGTLCLIDAEARTFSEQDKQLLSELTAMVEDEIATSQMLSEDHLTGLLNRRGFEQRAQHLLSVCQQQSLPASLLYFDLDNFKRINDEAGHQAGDQVLIRFAAILKEVFRGSDLVARLGGDEFAVLLIKVSEASLEPVLLRLSELIQDHNQASSPLQSLYYSCGIAEADIYKGYSLQKLYNLADQKMYRNKHLKKLT